MLNQERTASAVNFIRQQWPGKPRVGLILGSGLGNLASLIKAEAFVPYRQIPGFPCSTAMGHNGRLVCGTLAGVSVVAMEGRCHLYEGYSWDDVTLPVHVLCGLGAEALIVSNASGGVNPQLESGEIIVVVDHIDLMRTRDGSQRGEPTCDRSFFYHRHKSIYDQEFADHALAVARREGFAARRGIYAGLTGPNYETRAEYRMLRKIGADVVGMSTIPEIVAAAICGLRVLTLSVVTNVACPDAPTKTTGEGVVALASKAEPRLRAIILNALARL